MMTTTAPQVRRVSWRWLVAMLLALAPTAVQAQIDQIPGLGSNLPAKIMVIFDTSGSMQFLPGTNEITDIFGVRCTVSSHFSCLPLQVAPGNTYNTMTEFAPYRFDDFDPAGVLPCRNRFCIAKKVLRGVFTRYADDLQIGLAGFYQYRTQFTPDGGTTACLYDVIAGKDEPVNFSSTTDYAPGPATHVPPALKVGSLDLCSDPYPDAHKYVLTKTSSTSAADETCTSYRNDQRPNSPMLAAYDAGVDTNQFVRDELADLWPSTSMGGGCSDPNIVTFKRGGPTLLPQGISTPADSLLYYRAGARYLNGTTTENTAITGKCGVNKGIAWGWDTSASPQTDTAAAAWATPGPTRTLLEIPGPMVTPWVGNDMTLQTPVRPTGGTFLVKRANAMSNSFLNLNDPMAAGEIAAAGLDNCRSNSATTAHWRQCLLMNTGGVFYDDGRSAMNIFTDAGATFTNSGVTFSRDAGASVTTRNNMANGSNQCLFWQDAMASPMALGDNKVVADVSPFGFTPATTWQCANGGQGCRVTYVDQTQTTPTDSLQNLAGGFNATDYSEVAPSAPTYNCGLGMTGTPASGSGTYTGPTTDNTFRIPTAAFAGNICTANPVVTGSTYNGGGVTTPITSPAGCSAANPCELHTLVTGLSTSYTTGGTGTGNLNFYTPYVPLLVGRPDLIPTAVGGTTELQIDGGLTTPCPGPGFASVEAEVNNTFFDAGSAAFTGCNVPAGGCYLEFVRRDRTQGATSTTTHLSPSGLAGWVLDAGVGSPPWVFGGGAGTAVSGAYFDVEPSALTAACTDSSIIVTGAYDGGTPALITGAFTGGVTGSDPRPGQNGMIGSYQCTPDKPCLLKGEDFCYNANVSPLGSATVNCNDPDFTGKIRMCRFQARTYNYTGAKAGVCLYNRRTWQYTQPACGYTRNAWTARCPGYPGACTPCSGTPTYYCHYEVTYTPYSYNAPNVYCQVVGQKYEFSGTPNALHSYQYLTKGGEYLGTATVTGNSTTAIGSRNWCGTPAAFAYSQIQNECPAVITSASTIPSGVSVPAACTTPGRICKLRWRESFDAGVPTPGVFTKGRGSYAVNGDLVETAPSSTPPSCLVPDADAGGVVDPPDPVWLFGDGGVSESYALVPSPTTITDVSNVGTFTALTAGRYQVSFSAGQIQGAGIDTVMTVKFLDSLGNTLDTETTTVTALDPGRGLYTVEALLPAGAITIRLEVSAWTNGVFSRSIKFTAVAGAITVRRMASNFCLGVGAQPIAKYHVRSDFYQPGQPTVWPPHAQVVENQVSRESGWSLKVDGGVSQIFVPPAQGGVVELHKALGPCIRPTDMTTPLTGGFCISDIDNCGPQGQSLCQPPNPQGLSDFTPLYGTMKNAGEYMRQQLATDTGSQWACRDYYVLVVTDGNESTPALYTPSQVQTAVQDLRNTVVTVGPQTRTKDIKTFVIGFGAGLGVTDAGTLSDVDYMARVGGTALRRNPAATGLSDRYVYDLVNGRALSASDEAGLLNALEWVFSTISAGKFARSRPSLATDGQRIYQAYFERGDPPDAGTDAGSPELRGNLLAFKVEATGLLTQKWSYQNKLDDPSLNNQPRQLFAALPDGGRLEFNSTGPDSTELINHMNTIWGSSTAADVIDFVRNENLAQTMTDGMPRTTRSAAIMFSTPVVVGAPPFSNDYGGAVGEPSRGFYETFRTNMASRPARVIFGSTDGFIRGLAETREACGADESLISCINGREAWGIMPHAALSSQALKDARIDGLSSPIVDGTTAVADVCHNASGAQDCTVDEWRTLAISSMRGGGRALTALDITDGGTPKVLWEFGPEHPYGGDMGLSYSVPAIGRVSLNGTNKKWVAFVGAGYTNNLSNTTGIGSGLTGDSFYILDAKTGVPCMDATCDPARRTYWDAFIPSGESLPGRPGLFRPLAQADVNSYYLGDTFNKLWYGRVRPSASNENTDWRPRVFFDPTSLSYATYASHILPFQGSAGNPALILRMNKALASAGGGACVPGAGDVQAGFQCYGQIALANFLSTKNAADLCTLPMSPVTGTEYGVGELCEQYDITALGRQIRFFMRPRAETKSDVTGTRPDIFIGTGNPQNLGLANEQNFIMAIHDTGFTTASATPGAPLWIYALDPGEKVLGEPQFIGGSVIFATYLPTGAGCSSFGDSYLYSFNPATGEPTRAIADPSGVYTSTVRFAGSGPIDFVALRGRLYVTKTRTDGAPEAFDTREIGLGARVQGWRRVR